MKKIESFNSQEEALAFERGIEYVNDSSIRVESINTLNGKWSVVIEDDDYDNEDGEWSLDDISPRW